MGYKSLASVIGGGCLFLLSTIDIPSSIYRLNNGNREALEIKEYSAALENKDILEKRKEIETEFMDEILKRKIKPKNYQEWASFREEKREMLRSEIYTLEEDIKRMESSAVVSGYKRAQELDQTVGICGMITGLSIFLAGIVGFEVSRRKRH